MSEKDKERDDYFQKNKHSYLRSIGGLVTFSTIIPLNIHTTIEEMATMTWFWPVIGGMVGGIALIISYFLLDFVKLPSLMVATIIYSFFIIFNGFHHLDGLIDMGDALMVHGSPEKKIAIMRDSIIGSGGIAIFFIVAILSIASLNSIFEAGIIASVLICEMSAKVGLISCAISSKAGNDGTGKFFIKSMTIAKFLLTLIITIAIAYVLLGFTGIFGVLGAVLGGSYIAYLSKKQFKIATGDVLGAANEIGRLFSLVVMIIAIIWI